MGKTIQLTESEMREFIHRIAEGTLNEWETYKRHTKELDEYEREKQERWDKKHNVVHLTSNELKEHIQRAVNEALLDEIDGKTHARVPNATKKAKALEKRGVKTTVLTNSKPINHKDVISKAIDTEERANLSLIAPFTNTTFIFYATTRIGSETFVTFRPKNIKKLMDGIAILSGDITYKRQRMRGNIMIDFNKGKVYYTDPQTRYKYDLDPDNDTINEWKTLCAELKSSLDNRITPDELDTYVSNRLGIDKQ